jgi:hypothetical protein
LNYLLEVMTGLDISKRRGGRHRTLRGGAMVAVSQTLAPIAGRAAMKERPRETGTRQGHLGMNTMNTPPIVSPEAWEAARQKTLANEKAAENLLRNFPPGPLPDQTELPARPHAGAAPGYQGRQQIREQVTPPPYRVS